MKPVPSSIVKSPELIRPLVRKLHGYVPGEQPKVKGLIKLNTNENPYPPSPRVLAAVRAATDARLRLYPNPTAEGLRARLARLHGCTPQHLIVGNGSDELLALAVRAFVEPASPWVRRHRALVQYFHPSYSLYPVLAEIHGAERNPVSLRENFALPSLKELPRRGWEREAALTLITTPNAPSGCAYSTEELESICRHQRGVVVLDEAYVDFADQHALRLAVERPNVIVARTFSKAYALCFQRVGYFVGPPELIAALHKIRDSYNVNGLGQIAATATLGDLPYYRRNFRRIVATRRHLDEALTQLGFRVLPSQTNFLLCQPPRWPAESWLERLRAQKILVRWFSQPDVRPYLRISIGTEQDTEALLAAVKAILRRG